MIEQPCTFWHASATKLPVGTILRCPADYAERWSIASFYAILERYRPSDKLAHKCAVFMCSSDDDLDAAGGATEWVFEVKPLGPVERHDLNWSSAVSCAVSEEAPDEVLAQLSHNYWQGIPSEDPLWEWLTPAARVIAVERY